ncbi:protein kinase domain-containing protein [Streptomyces sp. NPDC055287]
MRTPRAGGSNGLAHPNIVTVHDFGSTTHNGQTCAYLVMELLPGRPLSAALDAGSLPMAKALYVTACVADALEAAHDAGLTHRDIKPSNIMIRSNGKATVVDFGITKGTTASGRHHHRCPDRHPGLRTRSTVRHLRPPLRPVLTRVRALRMTRR